MMSQQTQQPTLPRIDDVSALRARLWDAGFRPIPIFNYDARVTSPGKQPLGGDWHNSALQDPPLCAAAPAVSHALNTGLLCNGLRAIDIDVDGTEAATTIRSIALEVFGEAPMRYRDNSPRVLILYRAAEGEPPKRKIVGPNAQKVEVLGHGQQFVAFGIHDTGAELRWMPEAPGDVAVDTLPAITEAQVTTFLTRVAPIIGAEPPSEVGAYTAQSPSARGLGADALQVVAALSAIPNAGPSDWEAWNRVGMAAWAATSGGEAGRAAFHAWSGLNDAYDPAATNDRWNHYRTSPPTKIGAGTLFYMARQSPSMADDVPPPITLPDEEPLDMMDGVGWEPEPLPQPSPAQPARRFLSTPEFLSTFTNPDYIIDGIIQRGRLIALTSATGHGKTAVALYLATMITIGRNIGALEVEQGNVVFLAGENPDDLCGRFHAAVQYYGVDPERMAIQVLPGNFQMTPEDAEKIKQNIDESHTEPSLIIVDTAAAYFPGDDENHNVQAGAYARNLRVLTTCKGNPAVIVLCHPIKAASRDTLLPRGGGAFLAEVDANLTLWAESQGENTTLHWQGKIRGADFSPVNFSIVPVKLEHLKDAKGRPFMSVVATLQSNEEAEKVVQVALSDENTVLEWMRRHTGITIRNIALNAGWVNSHGSPNVWKVQKALRSLKEDKLVKIFRKKWSITDAGKKVLEGEMPDV